MSQYSHNITTFIEHTGEKTHIQTHIHTHMSTHTKFKATNFNDERIAY